MIQQFQSHIKIDEMAKLAVEENKSNIFEELKTLNPDMLSCLKTAAICGHLDIVTEIIENKFNKISSANVNMILRSAAEGARFNIIWYISENFIYRVTLEDIKIAETIVKQRLVQICSIDEHANVCDEYANVCDEYEILELLENMKLIVCK